VLEDRGIEVAMMVMLIRSDDISEQSGAWDVFEVAVVEDA